MKYAEAQVLFSADLVTWLKTNRTKMAGLLARGYFLDVCDDATIGCAEMPFESLEKYGKVHGASYGRVNSIECTVGMFECKPVILPRGQCVFSDLTARLGVVRGDPQGPVTARGRAVTLTWKEPPWVKPYGPPLMTTERLFVSGDRFTNENSNMFAWLPHADTPRQRLHERKPQCLGRPA